MKFYAYEYINVILYLLVQVHKCAYQQKVSASLENGFCASI